MPTISQWKLSEFFKRFAPRYLFGTTFTASPVFFETSLLTKVNRKNLEGAVVLCDQKGYQMSSQEIGALRAASSVYSLLYPPTNRIFHPKVWIMADDSQIAVLCGSGNMTQSGFIDNTELFDCFEIQIDGDHKQLADELLLFLNSINLLWDASERGARPGLRVLNKLINHIEAIAQTNTPAVERELHFLSSFAGDFPTQLANHLTCKSLQVASPYFGGKLKGIEALRDTLRPESLEVFPANQGSGIDINPKALTKFQSSPLRQLEIQQQGFAHLKLYGIIDDQGSHHTFTGSVNATYAALSGENIEAGILRAVTPDTYQALFTPVAIRSDLKQEHLDYTSHGDSQIGIYAILKEPLLELRVSENFSKHLPLSDTRARWICGAQSDETSHDILFDGNLLHFLRSSDYPAWIASQQNTSALELTGTTTEGKPFRSFAIIENFSDLTASPAQRNATNAIQSLFIGEGIAEVSGISSFFQLLTNTLDTSSLQKSGPQTNSPEATEKAQKRRVVPIWPPELAESSYSQSPSTMQSNSIPWLQRIIRTLIQEETSNAGDSSATQQDATDQDDEVPQALTKKQTGSLLRNKVRAWTEAEKQFTQLENKLCSFVLYVRPIKLKKLEKLKITPPQNKEKVLPTTIMAFLVTYLSHPGDNIDLTKKKDSKGNNRTVKTVQSKAYLILRFLHLILDNRHQGEDFVRPRNHPYNGTIFPPILEEVTADPDLELARDWEILIASFFVLLKIELSLNDKSILLIWLKFRQYSGIELTPDTIKEITSQSIRFGNRNGDLLDPSTVESTITHLAQLDWADTLGYQQTLAIMQAKQGEPFDESLAQAIPNWNTYLQVLSNGRSNDPILKVSRTENKCSNYNCAQAGTRHPDFKQLEQLRPCICHACGTAHIPNMLALAYQHHES